MEDNFAIDQEILLRVASGDAHAYKHLYNRYYPGVFRFAARFLEDRQAAEDITSEVFIRFWNRRAEMTTVRSIPGFLFAASRNACLNYLRDEKRNHTRRPLLLPDEPEAMFPPEDPAHYEIRETVFSWLETEISKLSPQQKSVLRLHLEGLKHEEISSKLGIAEKTVRNLKSNAVKTLRMAMLEKDLFGLFLLHITVFHYSF